jgi:membrane associated rhomboid family serine protease
MRAASVGFQCPDCVKEGASSVRPRVGAYGGTARHGEQPLVTFGLIGINLVMFVVTAGYALTTFGSGTVSYSSAFLHLAQLPQALGPTTGDGVAQGAYYRLLTACFLHFGILHIALNMFCLYQLGPYLEQALGRLRFIALYLIAGLGGSALSYAAGPALGISAGASGCVFGLFGAYYVLQRRHGLDSSSIVSTIALNLVFSFAVPGIDWRGHIGGLVAGGLMAGALVYAPRERRTLVQAGGALGVLLLIVVMVALRTHDLNSTPVPGLVGG